MMGKNNSSARILLLLFLITFVLYQPVEAQDKQTSITYSDEKLNQLLLAQHGFGWGNNLQPPVVSIEVCGSISNTDPNSPGSPRCEARGGLGRNGFWGYAPWILVHFKGLTMGQHILYIYPQGITREGKTKNFKLRKRTIKNNMTGWWEWFRSPTTVGKHCSTCWLTLCLDGPNNLVGGIEYSGSF